jgi:hypothetical protein
MTNKHRSLLFGGAAVLATTLCVAAPGWAQSRGVSDTGPQYSTPAEQQQTENLNNQYIDGTTQSPAALNGDPTAQTQPSLSQVQSDGREQQYQEQLQQYQAEQNRYQAEHGGFAQNLRAYDAARYEWSYPTAYEYRYGDTEGLRPLYLIAEPGEQLAQAPVEDPSGRWVGRVRNVETAPDGRPARVEVALNRRVSVWIRPGNLRFDSDRHVLFTDMTRDDLWSMPGATIESSSY